MENINKHVLDELKKTNGCTAWYLTLRLRRKLNKNSLTRLDISQNLQRLKSRKLVKNDGAHWKAIVL